MVGKRILALGNVSKHSYNSVIGCNSIGICSHTIINASASEECVREGWWTNGDLHLSDFDLCFVEYRYGSMKESNVDQDVVAAYKVVDICWFKCSEIPYFSTSVVVISCLFITSFSISQERNCLIWDRTHGLPFQAHTL